LTAAGGPLSVVRPTTLAVRFAAGPVVQPQFVNGYIRPEADSAPVARGSYRFSKIAEMTSAPPRRLDRRDVDLSHCHHRVERTLGRRAIWIGDRSEKGARRDLPRHAPLVLAPAARAL